MEKISFNPPKILPYKEGEKMTIPVSGYYQFNDHPVKYYECGQTVEFAKLATTRFIA